MVGQPHQWWTPRGGSCSSAAAAVGTSSFGSGGCECALQCCVDSWERASGPSSSSPCPLQLVKGCPFLLPLCTATPLCKLPVQVQVSILWEGR